MGSVLGESLGGMRGAVSTGLLTWASFHVGTLTEALAAFLRDDAPPVQPPEPRAVVTGIFTPPPGEMEDEAVRGRFDASTFWGSLNGDERRALLSSARWHIYSEDDVLCEEGEEGHDVIVIISGRTKVWVPGDGGQRILALRGRGELVGERAALTIHTRSATVTALEQVTAIRMRAHDFAEFLIASPNVSVALKRQVNRRQIEERGEAVVRDVAETDWSDGHCSVLFTDITGYSARHRTEDDQRLVVKTMYRMLEDAFAESGLRLASFYKEDRGDGALVIVPPATPTERVIDPMLAYLAADLRRYNRGAAESTALQLRVALDVGRVRRETEGVSGAAIIRARRMVEAPAVKRKVDETGACLAFVASEYVFENVIRPGRGLLDPARYSPVRARVKGTSVAAWMSLKGGDI